MGRTVTPAGPKAEPLPPPVDAPSTPSLFRRMVARIAPTSCVFPGPNNYSISRRPGKPARTAAGLWLSSTLMRLSDGIAASAHSSRTPRRDLPHSKSQAKMMQPARAATTAIAQSARGVMSPLHVQDARTASFARSGILSPTYRGDVAALLSPAVYDACIWPVPVTCLAARRLGSWRRHGERATSCTPTKSRHRMWRAPARRTIDRGSTVDPTRYMLSPGQRQSFLQFTVALHAALALMMFTVLQTPVRHQSRDTKTPFTQARRPLPLLRSPPGRPRACSATATEPTGHCLCPRWRGIACVARPIRAGRRRGRAGAGRHGPARHSAAWMHRRRTAPRQPGVHALALRAAAAGAVRVGHLADFDFCAPKSSKAMAGSGNVAFTADFDSQVGAAGS